MLKMENLSKFSSPGSSSFSSSMDKGKMWQCEMEEAGIDDELFEVLGYKVKSSDMVEVAHKIQQIEVALGNAAIDGYSQFPAVMEDNFHCNPSDMFSCLEGMLSGLNPLPEFDSSFDSFIESSTGGLAADDLDFGSDLVAIPGKSVFPNTQFHQSSSESRNQHQPPAKKAKTFPSMGDFVTVPRSEPPPAAARSILIDSQENGIRLVHTLMACAEAVQQENFKLAEALVKNVGFLAVSQAGAMRKVATYFAEALARRIYRLYPMNHQPQDLAFTDMLQMHFYETCPYLKFAHFTANQAILEAFAGKTHVHVIDFSLKQGMQWPALLQALAVRQGGPPDFRLTGIGPPSPDETDYLQEVGVRLAQFAKAIHVQFEFRGFVANSLADLDASLMDIREDETVAVNSIFELHPLLARHEAIDKVLRIIREVKPDILTVVEQEANHNSNFFLDRFTEALHYYSTLFDSLETCDGGGADEAISHKNKMMSEVYLGQQILNVVACEGIDRTERHESLTQWRNRFNSAGFEPVHLESNVYKQAITLLAVFDGDGYSVDENDGCLMLGWHTRPLITTSAWRMNDGYDERWNRRKYAPCRRVSMSECEG